MECPYCGKNMKHLDGYWYCSKCSAGVEDEEDDFEEDDESYGADDYVSSRPWGIDNDGW